MILKIIQEFVELAIVIAGIYFVVALHTSLYHPEYLKVLQRRRLVLLLLLILAASSVKVGEDVLGGESGTIDTAMLIFIHSHVPNSLIWFFEVVTLTGSSKVLFPLASIATIGLMYKKYRFEALLIAASSISCALVIYLIKMIVNRPRPMLWNANWYWGSSFPSGHTLAVTTFAIAVVLCVKRVSPSSQNVALSIAVLWTFLVAFSRLLLGAHWPTDVFVAACIGAFIPLAISTAIESCKN